MRHFANALSESGPLTPGGARRRRDRTIGVGLCAVLVLCGAALLLAVSSGAAVLGSGGGPPTIASDRADYAPGSKVTLSGSNWDPTGSPVHIAVNDDAGQTWSHSADITPAADGSIQDVFTLPDWFVANYSVRATQTTSSGTLSATTSFTDFDSDFKQCANDDSPVPSGVCHWIGGDLNAGKSNYSEGMSIPQRVILKDIPTAADHLHTLTFHIDATKGGTHAFDWLTSWQQALDTATAEGATFTDLNTCGDQIQSTLSSLCTTLDGESGANLATPDVPDDPFVSHDNTSGQSTQNKINAFETAYGNRTISVQADAPITIQSFTQSHSVPDGGDTGDSEIDFTLSWSSDATAVLVKFGAHLALGPNFGNVIGWGVGKGASSVNGGPYHVSLDQLANGALDGHPISLGSQDNNVQVGAIPALPQLIVIKHVINDNGGNNVASDFTMNVTGTSPTPASFPGAEAPGTTVTLGAGSYSVEESDSLGYTETKSADCSGSVTFGDTKTCTITNDDQAGTLIVKKLVINDNGGTKISSDFSFKVNNGTATAFNPAGDGDNNNLTAENDLTVNAGNYTVTEANTPIAGYTTSYSGDCTNVSVGNGQTKTCTITNDDKPGTIVVQKIVKPVGALTSFHFNTTGTGYNGFDLAGGQQNSQTLNVGNYTVKELVPLGWVLTGIGGSTDPNTPYNCTVTGGGGSTGVGDLNTQTATISLKNGDTVTCVFENTGQGVTRTQGFWATHSPLANIAWLGGTAFGHTFPGVSDKVICPVALPYAGRIVDDPGGLGKLMGGFWSGVSTTSTGAKRSALDQLRMQLLQQLLAAELNGSAFGSVPSLGTFAAWEAAYCGTNSNDIKTAQQQAASFNSAGDSSTFTPGTSADSKNARAIANLAFWNTLP
jgi:hypothetical protein